MNICSLTIQDPFGPSHGGTLRSRAFISALQGEHYVDVIFPAKEEVPSGVREQSASRIRRLKRHLLPMPTSVGARDSHLVKRLRSSRADLVLCSNLAQLRMIPLAVPLWIDFMDVWSLFATREADSRSGLAKVTGLTQRNLIRRAEAKYMSRATLITCAGYRDCQSLNARGFRATWVPTPVSTTGDIEPCGLRQAGFIGNFHYQPNVEALRVIIENWGPTLRPHGWKLLVAGLGSPSLSGLPPWVSNLGEVGNTSEFYRQVACTLSPVDLGGGMKVKVAESWCHGVPVIGTERTFEGFPPALQRSAIISSARALDPALLSQVTQWQAPADIQDIFSYERLQTHVLSLLSEAA